TRSFFVQVYFRASSCFRVFVANFVFVANNGDVNRRQVLTTVVLAACVSAAALLGLGIGAQSVSDTLPAELSDKDFWGLVTDYSEPDGFFRSDNLVSNERTFQEVIPEL